MLEYKIVKADSLSNLQETVNLLLSQGWELRGDVQILYNNLPTQILNHPIIFQVMTKNS